MKKLLDLIDAALWRWCYERDWRRAYAAQLVRGRVA